MKKTCNPRSSAGAAGSVALCLGAIVSGAGLPAIGAEAPSLSPLERQFLGAPVQITEGAQKAGEGYFSPDARTICYQAVPLGYPFYQIYVQDFDPANQIGRAHV